MKKKGTITIRAEIILLLLAALAFSAACWLILNVSLSAYLDDRFDNDTYYRQQDEKTLESLNVYIGEYKVASDDWYMLNKWVDREQLVYMRVYRDGELKFLSSAAADEKEFSRMMDAYAIETMYEKSLAYQVGFADGKADVLITGRYATSYYNAALLIQIIVPCILFISIIMVGIRRKVRYIKKLSEDITILEGGELDHPVTIYGRDELAQLAGSIDELRINFSNKLEEINTLQENNRDFITEMAHDLRTPMTPLLVYLGMLRENRFESDEERDNYIQKAYVKATQLKNMSDGMFTHFLMDAGDESAMVMLSMMDVFYDQVSAMIDYLKTSDFRIVSDIRMQEVSVLVNGEFIARIFDNLVSNILKYADPHEVIRIQLYVENRKVIYQQRNMVNELADHSTSTGFGVKNIRKMLDKMGGELLESQKNGYYETWLIFPVAGMDSSFAETEVVLDSVDE